MQNNKEKKAAGKHAAPVTPEDGTDFSAISTDDHLYGDEADLPERKHKKTPKKKKRKSRRAKKSPHRARKLPVSVSKITTPRGTSYQIRFFGREIRLNRILVLALAIVVLAFLFLNNGSVSLVEEKLTVVGLADSLENYRILVISDMNGQRFGDKQSALLRTINAANYQAIIFLGDMVGSGGDPEPFYELLEGIPAGKKVFFIAGDSDPSPVLDTPRDITDTLSRMVLADWVLGAIDRGATYVDSPVCLTVGSANIWLTPATMLNYEATEYVTAWKEQTEQEQDGVLAGLQTDYAALPLTSYRYRVAESFYSALNSMKDGDFQVLLAHEPPTDDFLTAGVGRTEDGKYLPTPDLVLAGHFCGGVVRLPAIGAFYVPDMMMPRNGWFPTQDDVRGLSTIGQTQKYITGGLSTNADVPILFARLLNPPEITLLTLSATLPENMLDAQ